MFPVLSGVNLASAALGYHIVVRAAVAPIPFDESFLDERIEVLIQPTVVNLLLVVVFEFVSDYQATRLVLPSGDAEEDSLESCKVVHCYALP